jgi:hypothetical protein
MRKLEWKDLFELMRRDNGGRWYSAHPVCDEYIDFNGYRMPSRSWPHSHSRPLLTQKFAKWCDVNHPEFAELYK